MAHKSTAVLPAAVLFCLILLAAPCFASSWVMPLRSPSSGEAKAQSAPAAPGGVSDSCVSSTEQLITVTWSAVTKATTYSIYKSTTSASSGYSSAATGQTGTSWTSGTLTAASYWFEVTAYIGTQWVSADSTATGETTIKTSGTKCTQP